MSETDATTTEAQSAPEKPPRCGKETASGPCVRPAEHKHGCMSQKVADNKKKGGSQVPMTPEEELAKSLLAQAREAAQAAKVARAAVLAKAEEERVMAWLDAHDLKAVPMTKKELAERDAQEKKAEEPEAGTTEAETTDDNNA